MKGKMFGDTDLVLVIDLEAGNMEVPRCESVKIEGEKCPFYEVKAMERSKAKRLEKGGIVEIIPRDREENLESELVNDSELEKPIIEERGRLPSAPSEEIEAEEISDEAEEKDIVELIGSIFSKIEITDGTVEMTITGENYDSLHPEIREFIEGHRKLAKTQEDSKTHGVDVKIGANIESLT